jgi:hypothetical protein
MKFIRITIVMVGFFLAPFFVYDKDYVAALAWTILLLTNLMLLVADEIKKHIDEKHEELLKELKNKSDE